MNTSALVNYLAGLHENNNKAWFVMNKPSYDILREEFVALVAEVMREVAKFDPPIARAEPKKCLFRIYKDTRFHKDGAPYKTNFSGAIAPGNKKDWGPHYYFEIDHTGKLMTAAGSYHLLPEHLRVVRDALAQEPHQKGLFSKAVGGKAVRDTFGGLWQDEKLTRPPKGFALDTPNLDWIKNRNQILVREVPLASFKAHDHAALVKHVVSDFKKALPLILWLRQTLGIKHAAT